MQSPAINQAMDILKLLRQVTESPDEVPVKLSKIIRIIAEQTSSDAASVYFAVDDNYLELFASYGLNETAEHKLTIRFGEGLIGEVQTGDNLDENDIIRYEDSYGRAGK